MIYVFDNCQINTRLYELQRGDQTIRLRPKVFEVLLYLLGHRDRVISKQELAQQVWPDQFISDSTLESTIRSVRQVLEDSREKQRTIQTRPGHGYRFVALLTDQYEEDGSQQINDRDGERADHNRPSVRTSAPDRSSPPAQPSPHDQLHPGWNTTGSGMPEGLSGQPGSPFFGRESDLAWFAHHLHAAMAGHPRVLLLEGEAGLGKTRLLKEMRSAAENLGVRVYAGRFFEHLTVPYLPFIEALRMEIDQTPGQVQDSLDTDAELIRQLMPASTVFTSAASVSTTDQSEQERIRLFLAVSRAILRMAQRSPSFFVVDDLHWADPSSLDLFGHLMFTLADAGERESIPLLLICAYRPEEGIERLPQLLARIQRENICHPRALQGLEESEVQSFLQSLASQAPSHQLTATVNQVTQGNPMFIQEVFHHMVQRDTLAQRGGYLVTTVSPADLRLPKEMTSAISDRIQAVSENCRRVLILAALYGDPISMEILEAVSGMDEEVLLDLLEEGIHHNLLVSEGQELWFTHSLIRHVFYHTPSAVRRQRLHQQIAQTLERQHAHNLDRHLRAITHHIIQAGSATDPKIIVAYAHKAGDQAFLTAAWSEAAQYYEAALSASESIDPFPVRDRAELHYRAGLARYRDMDAGPALAHYEAAVAAYQIIDDRPGVARALMEQTRIYYTLAPVPLGMLVDLNALEAALEALGEDETELHGSILTVMSDAYSTAQQQTKAKELSQKALEIGQRLQDHRLEIEACHVLGVAQSRSLNVHEGVNCFRKAAESARRIDDLLLEGRSLARLPVSLMRLGQLREVEAVGQKACELTRQYQDWGAHSVPLSALTAAAVAKGDFGAAENYAHEAMLMVSRSHYPWAGERAAYSLACAYMLRGEWAAAEAALDMLIEPGRIFRESGHTTQLTVSVLRQLIQSYAGHGAAPLALDRVDVMISSEIDAFSLDPWCALVELADFHQRPALAERLYQVLQRAEEQGLLFSIGWICLLPRVLGVAATLNRWWEVAESHFCSALDAAESLEALPELGRTYLDFAHMLVARDGNKGHQQARDLAKRAETIFTELDMHPFVQRVKRLYE